MTTEVPKPTVGDRAHALAKAGLSMIEAPRVLWRPVGLSQTTIAA